MKCHRQRHEWTTKKVILAKESRGGKRCSAASDDWGCFCEQIPLNHYSSHHGETMLSCFTQRQALHAHLYHRISCSGCTCRTLDDVRCTVNQLVRWFWWLTQTWSLTVRLWAPTCPVSPKVEKQAWQRYQGTGVPWCCFDDMSPSLLKQTQQADEPSVYHYLPPSSWATEPLFLCASASAIYQDILYTIVYSRIQKDLREEETGH